MDCWQIFALALPIPQTKPQIPVQSKKEKKKKKSKPLKWVRKEALIQSELPLGTFVEACLYYSVGDWKKGRP